MSESEERSFTDFDAISQTDLSAVLGLTTRQIRNLETAGVLTPAVVEGKKRYPWPESNHRYIAFKVQEAKAENTVGRARKEIDLRSSEIALAVQEMDFAEKLGSMVNVDDVEQLVERPLRIVYTMLKNLPARWGPEMVGCTTIQEAIARLKRAVGELLEVLREAADGLEENGEIDIGGAA